MSEWEIGMRPNGTGGELRRGGDRVWKGLDGRWVAKPSWCDAFVCDSLEAAMSWCDGRAAKSDPHPVEEHPGWEVRERGVNGEPSVWRRLIPGAVYLDGGARSTPPFQTPKSDRSELFDTVRRIGGFWWAHPLGCNAWGLYRTAGDAIRALDAWNAERSAETVRAFAGWVNDAVEARGSSDYIVYLAHRGRQAERREAMLRRKLADANARLMNAGVAMMREALR